MIIFGDPRMTLREKQLIKALNEVNKLIYARGAPLGSSEYFELRDIVVNAIREAGGKVE